MLQFVGKNGAVQIFGVKLVGVTAESGKKLLFCIVFILLVMLLGWTLRTLSQMILRKKSERTRFWTRQGIHLFTAALLIIGLCSIWFDDPTRLATALGLVTAGLAFALQRVVTAIAAYFVILRGKTFNVGDRIVMSGVRGDVIELGFIQTTIMEMGQPPQVQGAEPAIWVRARQYTGRIVTVTNDKIFETPVFNYTREFPFLWEEMQIPISYQSDLAKVEELILNAARKHTVALHEVGEEALVELERRYFVRRSDLGPKTFIRLTDNWVEISVRFLAREHGVRDLKDALSREILAELKRARIGIASGTYEIAALPPISVRLEPPDGAAAQENGGPPTHPAPGTRPQPQ